QDDIRCPLTTTLGRPQSGFATSRRRRSPQETFAPARTVFRPETETAAVHHEHRNKAPGLMFPPSRWAERGAPEPDGPLAPAAAPPWRAQKRSGYCPDARPVIETVPANSPTTAATMRADARRAVRAGRRLRLAPDASA